MRNRIETERKNQRAKKKKEWCLLKTLLLFLDYHTNKWMTYVLPTRLIACCYSRKEKNLLLFMYVKPFSLTKVKNNTLCIVKS